MFDNRLLKVAVQIGSDIKYYEDLKISVSGSKFANDIANEATVKISNLDKKTRDFILTESTPFKPISNQKIIVYAGRKSIGYGVVFMGTIFRSTIGQPPDITLTIKCLTGYADKGTILAKFNDKNTKLSVISKSLADSLKLKLVFEATDKTISNYFFNGAIDKEISNLSNIGGIDVFIDDNKLIVKDYNVPLKNTSILVTEENGMVGIPEITEYGIKVKYLYSHSTIGGRIQVKSKLNPATNGNYTINKLSFDLDNRDTPFYYTALGMRKL